MLFFLAGGGRPRVALPRAPRPTAASAPRARPAACCCGCGEALSGAGAARGAVRSRRLHPPPHPSPRGARPPRHRPRVSRPPRARTSRFLAVSLEVLCHWISSNLHPLPQTLGTSEPLPSQSSPGGSPPPGLIPGLHLLLDSLYSLPARGRVPVSGLLDLFKDHTLVLGCRPPGLLHFAWTGGRASSRSVGCRSPSQRRRKATRCQAS